MSPIYESEQYSRDKLQELRKSNSCAECGGMLNVFLDVDSGKAFLACNSDQSHEGIEREASRYEKEGLASLNIPTRREIMAEELGEAKMKKLERYEVVVSVSKSEAIEILQTIWPEAPKVEVLKAAIICHQYGLNPLWKHLFLIKFKKWNKEHTKVIGEDWVTVLGISTNRLIAQRRHHYSYLDMTPRRMTDEEQEKIIGEVDVTKIWAICKIKDMDTGAEVVGVGSWPMDEVPYGAEKGNTKLNMACIRSERQALDRQYPAEMPQGVEVIDEQYGAPASLISLPEGGDESGEKEEKQGEEGRATTTLLSPTKAETETETQKKTEVSATELSQETSTIDLAWLRESIAEIHWSEETARSWVIGHFKLKEAKGTLWDILPTLTREQAQEFVQEIQSRLEKQQLGLWD